EVEEHLFRIVQQALENAVKHASAKNITLAGQITPARATLMIGDDGQGFAVTQPLTLSGFLSKKRFGLAGMYERCALIEGDLHINSSPELGTQVRVEWRMPENDHYK
ncbi:MAG: hypothetical protein KDE51_21995, partial [Anaerolineales bacterium]|nr:hypothetical protein [Anaerolineales bacterium]